jgi:shikimate kinase
MVETPTSALGARSIVLVGLMGAGSTAIGRKVAQSLRLSFTDCYHEIEAAARMLIRDFESYGEAEFWALEARVIYIGSWSMARTSCQLAGGAFIREPGA